MTDAIKLASPLCRVVLGDRRDRSTWRDFEIQCTSADMVRAEAELIKQRLDAQKHSYQVTCAAVYFALKAEGRMSGGLGAFLEQLIDVDVLNADEDEEGAVDAVDPTLPDHEAG